MNDSLCLLSLDFDRLDPLDSTAYWRDTYNGTSLSLFFEMDFVDTSDGCEPGSGTEHSTVAGQVSLFRVLYLCSAPKFGSEFLSRLG